MKTIIEAIFGTYAPVMTTEHFVVSGVDGNALEAVDVVASGLAGVDWPWVAGVLLFAVVLYCLLRMIGGLLK